MRIALVGVLAVLLAGCGTVTLTPPPATTPLMTLRPTPEPLPVATPLASQTTPPTMPAPAATVVPSQADKQMGENVPMSVRLSRHDMAIVITDGLRARSKPSLGDDSIKYVPLLTAGTVVDILDGPVLESEYWWYKVAPLDACPTEQPPSDSRDMATACQFAFTNGEGVGWVASADHDGTPWLARGRWTEPGPDIRDVSDIPVVLHVGQTAVVIADDLRARSEPWVGPDSMRYEPLLKSGMAVGILEGPVYGSGYWWYHVMVGADTPCGAAEQAAGICFFAFTNGGADGWVAAEDHDRTPWLRDICDNGGFEYGCLP